MLFPGVTGFGTPEMVTDTSAVVAAELHAEYSDVFPAVSMAMAVTDGVAAILTAKDAWKSATPSTFVVTFMNPR